MTDKEYIKELKNFTTEKLITQMEYFGVDPYYTEVWWPTLKEIERRLKIAEEALKESQTTHDQMETQGERMTRIVHELSGCDAESATTTDCISRQQAIDAIEGVDWYHVNSKGELVSGSTSDEESWYKAEDIYKAIESLPPVEPKPVCEDAVSKGELMTSLQGIWDAYTPNNMTDFQDMLEDIYYKIKNAPSVTPTERTGEWYRQEVMKNDNTYRDVSRRGSCPRRSVGRR